jgi:hypothetical protein
MPRALPAGARTTGRGVQLKPCERAGRHFKSIAEGFGDVRPFFRAADGEVSPSTSLRAILAFCASALVSTPALAPSGSGAIVSGSIAAAVTSDDTNASFAGSVGYRFNRVIGFGVELTSTRERSTCAALPAGDRSRRCGRQLSFPQSPASTCVDGLPVSVTSSNSMRI